MPSRVQDGILPPAVGFTKCVPRTGYGDYYHLVAPLLVGCGEFVGAVVGETPDGDVLFGVVTPPGAGTVGCIAMKTQSL